VSIFDSIIEGVGDIVEVGKDIFGFINQSEIAAQETGVKQVVAETALAQQQLEAERIKAEADAAFFSSSTISQVAMIVGVAATVIAGLFLIFGGDGD